MNTGFGGDDENVLELDSADGCTTLLNILKPTELRTSEGYILYCANYIQEKKAFLNLALIARVVKRGNNLESQTA